ncbi:hypothetical protein BMF89_20400 [Arthrobacter sp. SRS-W-1-2016]|nr:hypothetical protein BMF89_20400 [Arthrobacter sp. SRS-W-1-2016]
MEGAAVVSAEGNKELMTPEQLAQRMGISLRMVRAMYYTNTWPHLRINQRTVRFTEGHYEQILELSEQRPTTLVRKTTTGTKVAELAELLSRKRAS